MTGLKGKTALVTGGGSGLGEAIAKALAGYGVALVVSDIKLEGAERVASEMVCFLLSDEASFITGGYYLVDGGYTAV